MGCDREVAKMDICSYHLEIITDITEEKYDWTAAVRTASDTNKLISAMERMYIKKAWVTAKPEDSARLYGECFSFLRGSKTPHRTPDELIKAMMVRHGNGSSFAWNNDKFVSKKHLVGILSLLRGNWDALNTSEDWRATRAGNSGFALIVAINLKEDVRRKVDKLTLAAKNSEIHILQEDFNDSNRRNKDINKLYRTVN